MNNPAVFTAVCLVALIPIAWFGQKVGEAVASFILRRNGTR